jgi:hypothetical protein
LLSNALHPTAGQVAMSSSAGDWAAILTALTAMTVITSWDATAFSVSELVISNAGFLAGAWLSTRYPMSRGRTFVINVGGGLGMLAGLATSLLMSSATSQLSAGMMAVGALTGLGVAAALTQDFDANSGPTVSFAPTFRESGGGVTALVRF